MSAVTSPGVLLYGDEAARRENEPLLPELERYVEDVPSVGRCLKHPLVYDVPLFLLWRANDQYKAKLEALALATREGRWHSYVFLHERPYRAEALETIAPDMEDGAYWELVSSAWTDTENHWQNRRSWSRLLRSDRPEREQFMDEEEREAFAALPGTLTVYRGWNGAGTAKGLAWTLDRAKAVWFARRLTGASEGQSPSLAIGTVRKQDTLGLLQGKGEQEIVVFRPGLVKVTERLALED